ncbi:MULTISPECIES: fatty acid desaturase [Synechococcaceae]|uniref:fatty acid desaturase n=1 Tax=Synechococcaceae TaxID=1890426 RepID=UPI000A81E632|nr:MULTISPECIES: fatty acid desaturase [Synechococcaceae]MCT4364721.1 fatty acid desaturase [Candidatus Regnicoccus frigidus MAG-AL1]MCT4366555.1 fatty acid desaturase [Candidatus Regnicoccus frigidus MAG-AL2]TWB89227.1 fatty acid desaturase [Synechococcus sp. Ace-Pa]
MGSPVQGVAEPAITTPPSELIPVDALRQLNRRADAAGWRQVAGHGGLILVCGLIWGDARLPWALRIPALLLLGWGLAFCFCAMHECGHRTAFASRSLNDAVAWWAGVLSFYNADFYRRYHQWHHRYTHQPGLDPELEGGTPSSRLAYGVELSGLPWWMGKLRSHWRGLVGAYDDCPYIPADAVAAVRASHWKQAAVYAAALLLSLLAGNGLLLWLWLLPLALGQPLLRFVLLAEHGGCSTSTDGLRNTRTTHTLAPLRWLMWNMPFHSEHHLFASIPFHALPAAHPWIAADLEHNDPGYLAVHRTFLADPSTLALPTA